MAELDGGLLSRAAPGRRQSHHRRLHVQDGYRHVLSFDTRQTRPLTVSLVPATVICSTSLSGHRRSQKRTITLTFTDLRIQPGFFQASQCPDWRAKRVVKAGVMLRNKPKISLFPGFKPTTRRSLKTFGRPPPSLIRSPDGTQILTSPFLR